MAEWREYGDDRDAPVRAKEKANGLRYGFQNGAFVPAFRVEFEELPVGHGIPGDRRLRWKVDPAHPLGDDFLASWARPDDPGDRLFHLDWEHEIECRYQLFVQAIHQDSVPLLNLLDLVNFVDPKIGFPMRSDMPAGQLDVMFLDPEDRQWVMYPQYRPYRYSTYCTGFGKPMVAAWFQAQEASLKYAQVYYGEEATTRPQSYFRPIEDFPGM